MGCCGSKGPLAADASAPLAAPTEPEPWAAAESLMRLPLGSGRHGGAPPPQTPPEPAASETAASGKPQARSAEAEAPCAEAAVALSPPSVGRGSAEPAMSNGFRSIPEPPSLLCSAGNVAPFTLPAQALAYRPPPDVVVARYRNGDSERKIHLNTELTPLELERLAQLQKEAQADGSAFFPSVSAMATRFLSRAHMDPHRALKLMKVTQEWRASYFRQGPISDTSVMEDMRHGIVYFCGRDSALRPAIVVRARRIPAQWYKDRCISRFIRLLVFCMEYFQRYMVVPGRVENLSVVADLSGLGVSQVPVSALAEVHSVMTHHYLGRVHKFYICNMSWMLGSIAGMVKAVLTERQRQKLNFLSSAAELRKDFALHQLEEDVGGARPVFQEFFPFPLAAGPFGAGLADGPDESAVPHAHEALSTRGFLGSSWNPRRSAEENTRLDFRPDAVPLLERCGLPAPPELLIERCGAGCAQARCGEVAGSAMPISRHASAGGASPTKELSSGVSTGAGSPTSLGATPSTSPWTSRDLEAKE